MELQVYNNTTIREVKEQFSRFFPFLKLEFFIYRHHTGEDSDFNKEVYRGLYLEETSEFFKEGVINFSPSTALVELEQEFQIELGLAAKVFRKSEGSWVDTTQTSHLSLGKQNAMAAAQSKPVKFNRYTLFL